MEVKSGRLKTPLQMAALFAGAGCLGWLGGSWEKDPSGPQITPTAASLPLTAPPVDQLPGSVEYSIWLAAALADADGGRMREIVARIPADAEPDLWQAVFLRWCKVGAADAWEFARQQSGEIRLIALEEWAARDPKAALAAVGPPDEERFKALIRGALRSDIEAAFRFLGEVQNSGITIDVTSMQASSSFGLDDEHFAALATKDPAKAIEWAERLDPSQFLGPAVVGWLERSSAAAGEWLEQRPDRNGLLGLAMGFMSEDAESYRPQTMDFLMATMPAGDEKSTLANRAMGALAYSDPDLAIREMARIFKDPGDWMGALGQIAGLVAETDPEKAWKILGLANGTTIRRRIVLAAGTGDPLAEEDQWETSDPSNPRFYPCDVKSGLLGELMAVDKDRAIRLMNGIPVGELMRTSEKGLLLWRERDPQEMFGWLARKLGQEGDPEELRNSYFPGMDDESLRELLTSLPPGTVHNVATAQLAGNLAIKDARAALEFAREKGGGAAALEAIYAEWASSDPEQALENLVARPDAPPAAWGDVVGKSLEDWPQETVAAVELLPVGAERDAAVAALVNIAVEGGDLVPAAGWAVTLQDAKKRGQAIGSLIDRAGRDLRLVDDGESIGALGELILQSVEMPEEERQRWLDRIESLRPKP